MNLQHGTVAEFAHLEIGFPSRTGLFLKTMKDINRFTKAGEIEDPVLGAAVQPDLHDAGADDGHGAEVRRCPPALNEFQMVARIPSNSGRRTPQPG